MKIGALLGFMFLILFGCNGTNEPRLPDISKAKAYQVISNNDFSFPGRKRLEQAIVSSASTFEERAQTAMQAAIDLQKKTKADVVSIWLEISPGLAGGGHQLATARYAPDGGGFSGDQDWKWEVEAAEQAPDPLSVKVGELWYQKRKAFAGQDGLTDEPKLKEFIAQKLGVNPDQVLLPWISTKEYRVK
jgi:hypothetical protein